MSSSAQNVLRLIKVHKRISALQLSHISKTSRVYAHRLLRDLVHKGLLERIGHTKGAFYVLKKDAHRFIPHVKTRLLAQKIEEDQVFENIKGKIPHRLKKNVDRIFRYAFTEMLNNAIDHSTSKYVWITVHIKHAFLVFTIRDRGIGIFEKMKDQFGLQNHREALEHLLKGKQTTDPKKHSGEGIFFTSKSVDQFIIQSAELLLLIDNEKNDFTVKSIPFLQGTLVECFLRFSSRRDMKQIFDQFTNHDLRFKKTQIVVKLYQWDTEFISRSQAKRLLMGIESFDTVILDFNRVEFVGQGFADEVFRVYQSAYPSKEIIPIHMNEEVSFMINRSRNRVD